MIPPPMTSTSGDCPMRVLYGSPRTGVDGRAAGPHNPHLLPNNHRPWGAAMARSAVVLVLLYPCLVAAAAADGGDKPRRSPAADPTGMAGYWKPESIVYDGVEQFSDAASRQAITLVVKDGEYRVYFCKDKEKD